MGMALPINNIDVPGWNFDAWPRNSMVTLVNVPWSNTYRDVVRFPNRGALNAYIDAQVTEQADIKSNMSYVPTNRPIKLADPENRLYRYNYLRVSNPTIPGTRDHKQDYYYFITDVQFVNGDTTMVTVQLDVFQTFIYDVTFGNCYVERGHISLANSNRFENYGRTHLTLAEGMDTGAEYVNTASYSQSIMSQPGADYLICSTVSLSVSDFGTVSNPRVITASGGLLQGVRSGASYYVVKGADIGDFMSELSDYPWIAQGIISITAIPPVTRYIPTFSYTGFGPLPIANAPANPFNPIRYSITQNMPGLDWRNELRNTIPSRYRALDKFLTFPYSYVELTTNTGTPLVLRPESWASDDLEVTETISFPLPNQRIGIYPYRYNARGTSSVGDDWSRATGVTNLPQVAIVNDNATLSLASQAHSIAYSKDTSDWSQQKALRGSALSYDQSQAASNLSTNLMNNSQANERANLANQQQWANQDALLKTATNTIGGAVGGMALGGVAGGVAGAIGGGSAGIMGQIQTGMNNQRSSESLALNQAAAQRANALQSDNASYVRDTNKSLSDWAARGDYENNIAGINAKIQDTQTTPPSVVGQLGGEMFNFAINANGQSVYARVKRIDDAHISMIGEYWLRYGYAVNRFYKPTNLHAMSKFTYWKMSESYITAAPMPETYKQAIRGIFEKGVTVWHNPADIGNVDNATNAPLGGISY